MLLSASLASTSAALFASRLVRLLALRAHPFVADGEGEGRRLARGHHGVDLLQRNLHQLALVVRRRVVRLQGQHLGPLLGHKLREPLIEKRQLFLSENEKSREALGLPGRRTR